MESTRGVTSEEGKSIESDVNCIVAELMVEPVPKQTKDGFEPWELPANQYTRMGDEALALQDWLAQSAT